MTVIGNPVVVGFDGSDSSRQAVRLAAELAAGHRRALRVVHAFIWPELGVSVEPPPGGPADSGLANQAARILADGIDVAQRTEPDVEVSGEVVTGAPAAVLLGQSESAELIVVGDRGLGGFGSLLLGSVAVEVGAHARCPVIVARGEGDREGPVLVGVDGSEWGLKAIEFGFAEAARRGSELVALHAYKVPVAAFPGDMLSPVTDFAAFEEEERRLLHETIAGFRSKYPDVAVEARLVHESSARALVDASREASLVVVGSRGLGGFRGLLLGSVTHAVMHHAACPVAVIR